jgi:hypothetical protein
VVSTARLLVVPCGRLARGGHDGCIAVDSAGASPSILAVALPDRNEGQSDGLAPLLQETGAGGRQH